MSSIVSGNRKCDQKHGPCADGSSATAEALMTAEFIQHQQALARFAGRLSSGRGDLADDILQQTFLQAWRNKHRVDYSRCCKSWLMRIMKNEFLQITRKNRNHEELCEDTMPGALELTASPLSNFEFLDLIQSISDLSVDQRHDWVPIRNR